MIVFDINLGLMTENVDIWRFLAGLGLFLLGMSLLESGVRKLAGRRFKLFIRKHTGNRIKGILGGTAITAILQSSSLVSLMLLAFVGAGVISMQNALGVIMGSNLGTTFTGWLVTTLGFKLEIEVYVLPFLALGSLLMVFFPKRLVLYNTGRFVVGLSFLLMGLGYMKTGIEQLATGFDISSFADYGPFVFLLVGFVVTAIIQSSSATMVITLSALSGGIISFQAAAAMVIGADLGTTLTVMLGGLTGISAKRRVALGHFLFNLVTDVMAFILLNFLLFIVVDVLGVKDQLYGLVLFHSLFNIMGIILFFPFIKPFATFLNSRFKGSQAKAGRYIHELTAELPDAALEAFQNETRHLIDRVFNLMSSAFNTTFASEKESRPAARWWMKDVKQGFKEQYYYTKQLQGEMINFCADLQKVALSPEESQKLNLLMDAMRNAMHAAKGLKDVVKDLNSFRQSSRSSLNNLYMLFRDNQEGLFAAFDNLLYSDYELTHFENLGDLQITIRKLYDNALKSIYEVENRKQLLEVELATVLNVNRELYTSNQALVQALIDVKLKPDQALEFENLPLYQM